MWVNPSPNPPSPEYRGEGTKKKSMGSNSNHQRIVAVTWCLALGLLIGRAGAESDASRNNPDWTAPHRFRIVLVVDPRGRVRSHSPASVELGLQSQLGAGEVLDEHSIEVVGARRKRTTASVRSFAARVRAIARAASDRSAVWQRQVHTPLCHARPHLHEVRGLFRHDRLGFSV